MENSSLDRLAHIANMTHELQRHDMGVKNEAGSRALAEPEGEMPTLAQQNRMKKMACTCCRQQKSKCDAHERHPLPCTQCARKNLVCEVDANFRRKGKRAHLARIEREFLELKRLFQDPHAAEDFHKTAPNLAAYVDTGKFSPSVSPEVQLSSGPEPNFPRGAVALPSPPVKAPPVSVFSSPKVVEIPDSVLACEEKSLDAVVLSPETIRELYLEYVRHYHPILPVVDVSRGPERIHRLCPALFWVVMFVALRRHDSDKLLLLRLLPLVKNVLAEISISPITRYNPTEDDEPILNACLVYSVQAFILYSLWPPLTSSLSADLSWNTIGVALFQAIRIGLHSSGQLFGTGTGTDTSPQQYAMAQEQMKTWIICNIVSENIATAFGFPAFVQFDFLSAQHCDLPLSTRHVMEIAHFEDQVARTLAMGANTDTGLTHINERIALVKVLLKQLDDLEIKLLAESRHEDGHRKLHYLVARIHLLTCYFLDAQNIPNFELSKGLVRLFNAAIALMAHVEMCEAKTRAFVKYLPVVSILHIWQASCIIVKLANSPLKSVLDVELAKNTYLSAIRLVARASVLKHDISYRASGIMRNMWQLFRTLDEKHMSHLHLKIKSRMTASVFFDCLSLLRDKVGMAKLNIKTDLRDRTMAGPGNPSDNDDDDDDEGNLYDDSDQNGNAVSSDEEQPVQGQANSNDKTTPGSNASLGRTRKKRRLSDLHDAESKARQIIRTIPLDPQPISASNRSTIFKVVNPSTNSSPSLSVKTDDSRGYASPGSVSRNVPVSSALPLATFSHPPTANPVLHGQEFSAPALNPPLAYSASDTLLGLELDMFNMNNDLLWKDVDSLMNDFGFHT